MLLPVSAESGLNEMKRPTVSLYNHVTVFNLHVDPVAETLPMLALIPCLSDIVPHDIEYTVKWPKMVAGTGSRASHLQSAPGHMVPPILPTSHSEGCLSAWGLFTSVDRV